MLMRTRDAMKKARPKGTCHRTDATQRDPGVIGDATFYYRHYLEAVTMADAVWYGRDFMRVAPMNLLS